MRKIRLGDIVQCKYTGFKGVAVAKTEFINECIQFSVAPKVGEDNKFIEDMGIDEGSLIIVPGPKKKRIAKKSLSPAGGASQKKSMRGY